MKSSEFKQTKKIFRELFSAVQREKTVPRPVLDEAAYPAYTHENPIIDKLFWNRIKVAIDQIESGPHDNILDFGCGSGVLSFLLAKSEAQVTATDSNLNPIKDLQTRIIFPPNIDVLSLTEADKLTKSFDTIAALDVLEHVENLKETIQTLGRLLKPGGRIIVSGPTETKLYKLGRKIAGKEFTGNYHVSNIMKIKKEFENKWVITKSKSLPLLFPLFVVFTAEEL